MNIVDCRCKFLLLVAFGIVSVLLPSPPRDIPEVVNCRWGIAEIRNSKVQGTQSLSGHQERNTLRPVW
jgi:hypothetical protein